MVTWSDNEVLQLISFWEKKRCKRNWKDQRETSTSMKRSLRRWLEMVSTSLATSAELK